MSGLPADRETLEERVDRTIRHIVSAHPDMETLDPNWLEHPLSSHEAIHRPSGGADLYDHGPAPAPEPAQLQMNPSTRFRVGRTLGRTVYDGDTLIGLMDTPDLATMVVRALNRDLA